MQGPLIGIGGSAPLTSLLTPLTTGSIYQRFSSPAAGTIENIIEFSLPPLLRPGAHWRCFFKLACQPYA